MLEFIRFKMQQKHTHLVPMCQRLCWRRGQPHCRVAPNKRHVEPERQPVHRARRQHVELERNLDAVQLRLVRRLEINHVALRLGRADANVEGIHHRLAEVFLHGGGAQVGQVHPVEIFLLPKVDLVELFHVQGLVREGRYV